MTAVYCHKNCHVQAESQNQEYKIVQSGHHCWAATKARQASHMNAAHTMERESPSNIRCSYTRDSQKVRGHL